MPDADALANPLPNVGRTQVKSVPGSVSGRLGRGNAAPVSLMPREATGREDDMGAGEEITAAWDAWRDAKRAYDDEAAP